MSEDTIALVTNPEVLAVDQDSDCAQGSLVRFDDATETWIKPLHEVWPAAARGSACSWTETLVCAS